MAIQMLNGATRKARPEELLQAHYGLSSRTGDNPQSWRITGYIAETEAVYKARKLILPQQCSVARPAPSPPAQGRFRDADQAARWQLRTMAGIRYGKFFAGRPEACTRAAGAFPENVNAFYCSCLYVIVLPHKSG